MTPVYQLSDTGTGIIDAKSGVSGAGIFGTQFFGKGDYEGQKYAFRFKVIASTVLVAIALTVPVMVEKRNQNARYKAHIEG